MSRLARAIRARFWAGRTGLGSGVYCSQVDRAAERLASFLIDSYRGRFSPGASAPPSLFYFRYEYNMIEAADLGTAIGVVNTRYDSKTGWLCWPTDVGWMLTHECLQQEGAASCT
jgi:hypothetical protein